jgi:hypothetical protein
MIFEEDDLRILLTKFLNDSMESLSKDPEAMKTQKGKWIEDWLEDNLYYFEKYTNKSK